MKKSLLLACSVGLVLSLTAQNSRQIATKPSLRSLKDITCMDPAAGTPVIKTERKNPLVITNATVCDVTTGSSGNAYGGFTRPGRPIIDYHPTLNLLTIVHRSNPSADGTANTGHYTIDISKDGGTTWSVNQGPIYSPGAELGRYPKGVIYNPSGNTNPDNAYLVYDGPCTNGSAWVAYANGAAQIGNPGSASQNVDIFNSTVNFRGLIPDAMVIANGTAWVSDWTFDGTDYTDTILIRKGTWNPSTNRMDFTTTKVPFPVTTDAAGGKLFTTTNIAFSANGQTGYLSAIANGDITFDPDSSSYITVWKTTDGGNTWSAPYKISVDVNSQMGTSGVNYSCSFQLDGAVDNTGKLHLITGIHPYAGGGSVTTAPGTWGEFSIITDGSTSTLSLLDKPQTFRGTFGGISEDSRGQISLSQNGDKVFYVWFDTDTATFPGGGNTNPNALARMYDVATMSWDPVVNLTAGTAADGVMTFGYVAYWAGQGSCGAGSYNVHLAYQALTGSDTQPVDFHYVCGVCITSVGESPNTTFSVDNAYPNPTSGNSSIEITMKKNDKITVEVSNLLGQVIYAASQTLNVGTHTIHFDASKWNSGVYFYTVKSKEFEVSGKLVRE